MMRGSTADGGVISGEKLFLRKIQESLRMISDLEMERLRLAHVLSLTNALIADNHSPLNLSTSLQDASNIETSRATNIETPAFRVGSLGGCRVVVRCHWQISILGGKPGEDSFERSFLRCVNLFVYQVILHEDSIIRLSPGD